MKETNSIVIRKQNRKHKNLKMIEVVMWVVFILGITIVDFVFRKDFVTQGKLFLNDISDMLGKTFGEIFPIYSVDISQQGKIPVFIITLVIVVTFLFYITLRMESICVNILGIACTVIFYGLFGNKEQIAIVVLFFIGNIIAIRRIRLRNDVGSGDFAEAILFVRMLFVAAVIAIASVCLGNKSMKIIEDANYIVKQTVETVRYHQEDDTALVVTMRHPESYYLRGFVGTQIGAYGWKEIGGAERYENSELFYWLHKNNFFGQSQLAQAAAIFNKSVEKEAINEIHIKNVGASLKYVYVPYEYVGGNEKLLQEKVIGDENIKAEGWKGKDTYIFQAVSNQVSKYPEILKNIDKVTDEKAVNYIQNEGFYNEYVYKSYRDLSEEDERILDTYLGNYDRTDETHFSYETAKEKILNMLSEKITYVADTKNKRIGEDFLKSFLEINCKGNDAIYASATTLMFRYYGIPARYVEGYLITPDDAENAESDKPFDIPQNNRHCWSEYYQDGVGWIPFETAPPYIDLMEKADEISGAAFLGSKEVQQDIQEIKQDNYEEQKPEEKNNKNTWNPVRMIIILSVTILICLSAAYLLRYIGIKKKRRQMLESRNNNMVIKYMFNSMMNIMFEFKLEKKNQLLKYYGADMAFADIEGKNYDIALKIYEKACYSGGETTKEERKYMLEYMEHIRNVVYQSLNLIQKIRWKIVLVLD